MSDQFWLTREHLARIEGYFPLSHGKPRVDDLRVVSGVIHVLRNGLRLRNAPAACGLTRRSTTGSSAGASLACSIGSLPNWPANTANRRW